MAEINISVGDTLIFIQQMEEAVVVPLQAYGSLAGANSYFASRLRMRGLWANATDEDKNAALTEAREWIDRLNFQGCKTVDSQLFEFPRDGSSVVPMDIEKAAYEIAAKLLDGMDPELEIKNLGSTSQGFGPARTTYDRAFVLEHLSAGIVSAKAYALLKPFLNDSKRLQLCRVE